MDNFIFFPGIRKKAKDSRVVKNLNVRYISVDFIISNPFGVRENYDGEAIIRLADSIRRYGMIEPLGVRRFNSGKYELVFGERRLRAAKLIDMREVPCIVMENISRRTSCELAFAENTMREELNVNEKARGVETLIRRFNVSRDGVCRSLSIYRDEMNFLQCILHLSAYERDLICNSSLSAAHIKPLLKIENDHVRRHLMKLIVRNSIPAAGCEKFIEEFLRCPSKKEEQSKKTHFHPVRRLILKDIRVFINSIDHAVELVRSSGIDIKCDKVTGEDCVSYTISIAGNKKTQKEVKTFI